MTDITMIVYLVELIVFSAVGLLMVWWGLYKHFKCQKWPSPEYTMLMLLFIALTYSRGIGYYCRWLGLASAQRADFLKSIWWCTREVPTVLIGLSLLRRFSIKVWRNFVLKIED